MAVLSAPVGMIPVEAAAKSALEAESTLEEVSSVLNQL